MQRRQPPSRTVSQSSEQTSTSRREQRKKRRKARNGARSGSGADNPLVCFFVGLIVITIIVLVLGVGVAVGVVGSNYYSDRQTARALRTFEADNAVITQTDNVFPPPFPVVSTQSTTTSLSKYVLDMCANTLWHTLKTTTIVLPNDESFIHTGDIDDLWLRDSAGQVHPLLLPWFPGGALVAQDTRLARVVSGLIRRSAFYIRHDPYANAFRIDTSYIFNEEQKRMGRHDYISTWNYELDSGCYYIRMLYFYWKALPDAPILREKSVFEAVSIMVDLWIAEQDHENDVYPQGELFDCQNCKGPFRYPGLQRGGKGRPTKRTGMTWAGFRPSDDECQFNYLVPANMFAVVALGYATELAQSLWAEYGGNALAAKAAKLASEIDQGIKEYGIVEHEMHGRIYAYEVDGLGNSLLMDDANIPSLLSAPYIGYKYDEEVYGNTKRFIYSTNNPTYQSGTNALTGEIDGYGSPHMKTAIWKNIWPMSMAMRGLVSNDIDEKVKIINQLHKASAGTGWMHESFDVNNPKKFTRPWFCWSDALFAELVMSVSDQCPGDAQYKIRWWRDPQLPDGGKYAGRQQISKG